MTNVISSKSSGTGLVQLPELAPEARAEIQGFHKALGLAEGHDFHILVADTLAVLHAALDALPEMRVVRPRPTPGTGVEAAVREILSEIQDALDGAEGRALLIDAMIATDQPHWALVFQRLNAQRNGLEKKHPGPLSIAVTPRGETLLGHNAPDLWSRRGSGMRLRDPRLGGRERSTSPLPEPPPPDAEAFESFCLDLFKVLWDDPGARKGARMAQPRAGVDIFGQSGSRWIGVQCRTWKGEPHERPTAHELREAVGAARNFEPRLDQLVLATTGPRQPEARALARDLTTPDLRVEIWAWPDLWDEVGRRPQLMQNLLANSGSREQASGSGSGPWFGGTEVRPSKQLDEMDRSLCEIENRIALGTIGGDSSRPIEELVAIQKKAAGRLEQVRLNPAPPLDIALAHLGLGRATLYRAILEGTAIEDAKPDIEAALDNFRRAGRQDYLPLGLLTRAWMRSALGDRTGSRHDLDEAERIAVQGPMPLHLADVHLYRARLFRDRRALAEARRLVDQHGYGRRLGELEALERAAADWPDMPSDSFSNAS